MDDQTHQEETSPCFSWYPGDWRGSRFVRNMSWKERGFYRECLDWAWELNGLPSDEDELRDTLGATAGDFRKLWPVARRLFELWPDGRWRNARQERERDKQRTRRQRASDGGKAKAQNNGGVSTPQAGTKQALSRPEAAPVTAAEAVPSLALALSPALALALSQSQESPPADARSKRPMFTGQRLTVFEWMLDDCMRTLGEHADAFDLHEWFYELDAQAVRSNLVIPRKQTGDWLQAQLVAEAQRRGLPLKFAEVPSAAAPPANKRVSGLVAGGEAFLRRTQG